AIPVLTHIACPLHLPIFIFAKIIDFTAAATVHPLDEELAEDEPWIAVMPHILVARFQEVVNAIFKQGVIVGNGLAFQIENWEPEDARFRSDWSVVAVELPLEILARDCSASVGLPTVFFDLANCLKTLLPGPGPSQKCSSTLPFSRRRYSRGRKAVRKRGCNVFSFSPQVSSKRWYGERTPAAVEKR